MLLLLEALGAQMPAPRTFPKHVLAWADVRNGYQHESITHALSTIERLGWQSGLYDTIIRTDSQLIGTAWLAVVLLYGAGLRLTECLELRVKDVDFGARHIVIREPKGGRDRDPRWGPPSRYHLHESVIQRAVTAAARRAGMAKPASPHTFRDAFARGRRRQRTVQELLGHRDVSTTMLYTHVLNRGPLGVRSPADRIPLTSKGRTRRQGE